MKAFGRFGNDAELKAGVGANDPGGFLRLGRNVIVDDGWPVAGDTVSIGNNSSVYDVLANQLLKGSGVQIRGTQGTPDLPLMTPYCPIPTLSCGAASQVLFSGDSKTLPPGTYGDVLMQNGATLTLTGGTYDFCSIRAGRNGRIEIQGAANSSINVVGDVRLSNGSFFGPVGGAPTPFLTVGGNSLRVGSGTTIRAFIMAPNAVLSMGRGAHVIGTFCVLRTRSDKHIILECPPDATVPSPSGAFLD